MLGLDEQKDALSYRAFYDRILSRIDAERAHSAARLAMRALAAIPGFVRLLDRMLAPRDDSLRLGAMGLEFRSPLGLAAGADKDAGWYRPLGALGFGFVEVGTITAEAQPGNPRPRVTRLPADRALLNAMGFPNPGAAAAARRLRCRRDRELVVGVNVGKTKVAPDAETAADYRRAVREVGPLADFLVVNVSSPNTPGLVGWQEPERLDGLLAAVQEEMAETSIVAPLLLKLGPDLGDDAIRRLADLALARGLAGIVAVNTSVDHAIAGADHGGGVSGGPLRERALEVLEILAERAAGRLTLVSVGGVETAEDAWERILAGASLVQAYTGFVYGGPLWPRRVNKGLSQLLADSPWDRVEEAVGAGPCR